MFSRIFRSSKPAQPQQRGFRPQVESLGDRVLPAAGLFATLDTDILKTAEDALHANAAALPADFNAVQADVANIENEIAVDAQKLVQYIHSLPPIVQSAVVTVVNDVTAVITQTFTSLPADINEMIGGAEQFVTGSVTGNPTQVNAGVNEFLAGFTDFLSNPDIQETIALAPVIENVAQNVS